MPNPKVKSQQQIVVGPDADAFHFLDTKGNVIGWIDGTGTLQGNLTTNAGGNTTSLQGNPIAPTIPQINQTLIWDGSKWSPSSIASGGVAPLNSPVFIGTPTAPTPLSTDNSTTIANTSFVQTVIANKVIGSSVPRGVFDVRSFGAVGDGKTNDLAALQAAVDAIDAAGGGTLWLGPGNYNIGTGTWKIGTSAAQHHINIEGMNANSTVITCDTSGGNAAIYLNLEKYVVLKEFSVINQGAKGGYGIQFGGDSGAGTQTNGNNVSHLYFQGFTYGAYMSGGIGTSSEIIFDHCRFELNTYGFFSANFNALNFLFLMVEIYGNTTAGLFIANGNMTVIGGASSNNGVDFNIAGGNDGQVKIVSFRAETPVGDWLIASSDSYISIEDCILHPTVAGSEVINATGELHIKNSALGGFIRWNGSTLSAITLDHVSVNTPGTDWTLSNQISSSSPPFGPGFRMTNNPGFQASARAYIRDVYEASTATMYPDIDGVLIARPSDSLRAVVGINKGQGATLTLSSNTLAPYAYSHHVNDASLMKNLSPISGFGDWATSLILIPDQAFTTDTTGNIGKASTAVVGQPMIFTKDLANGKWYPSY
jgi:hypothetical protein